MMRLPGLFTRLGVTILAGGAMLGAVGCASNTKPPVRTTAKTFLFYIPYGTDNCPQKPVAWHIADADKCNPPEPDCAVVTNIDTVEFSAIKPPEPNDPTPPKVEDRHFFVYFAPFENVGRESTNSTTGKLQVRLFRDKPCSSDPGSSCIQKTFNFWVVDRNNSKCPLIDPRIIVQN